MRMPIEYPARPEAGAVPNGCFYFTPPTEYHRYGYRGFRRVNDFQAARPENFNNGAKIICDVAAAYSGGETFFISVSVYCGSGGNGGSGAAKNGTFATFEYDTGGGVTPGNVPIDISAAVTAADVAAATAAALATELAGYALAGGVDPGASNTALAISKGPKAVLGIGASGLPGGASVGNVPSTHDDVANQSVCRRGAIEYTLGAGGPSPWYMPTGRGQSSLFLTFNP